MFEKVDHECKRGCIHWCPTSPTKGHRWKVVSGRFGARVGTCRYCHDTKTFDPEIAALAALEAEATEVDKEPHYDGYHVQ